MNETYDPALVWEGLGGKMHDAITNELAKGKVNEDSFEGEVPVSLTSDEIALITVAAQGHLVHALREPVDEKRTERFANGFAYALLATLLALFVLGCTWVVLQVYGLLF